MLTQFKIIFIRNFVYKTFPHISFRVFQLIVSVILILNYQMNSSADAANNLKSFSSPSVTNFHKNKLITIPPVFFDENQRVPHRDIKNHNRKTRYRVSTFIKPLNKPQILPKIPSLYLEPPTIVKHYWNNKSKKNSSHEKLRNNSSAINNHEEVRPNYIRDHAPANLHQEEQETTETEMKENEKINENLNKRNRVDFHVHGHQGPNSYIFGFDTGLGKNRQFRLEEKHANGTVSGHYGYYDARGKLRKIYYTSDPAIGYEESTNGHSFGH